MTYKKYFFLFFIIILQINCKKIKTFETNLSKNSIGKTLVEKISEYPELKIALEHYKAPEDSLKRTALIFLINNLENKTELTSMADKDILPIYEKMYLSSLSDTFDFNKKYKHQIIFKTSKIVDLGVNLIKADELIENIDLAFEAYQFPWAKKTSFRDFCEFVLPHRILNEPMSNWRKFYLKKNEKLIEYLLKNKINDPTTVCKILNDSLIKKYKFYDNLEAPYTNLIALYQNPIGKCVQRYLLYTALARSIGLPVAIDFTPQYGNYPGSHNWVTLVQKNKFSFNAGEKWEPSTFGGVKYFRNVYSNSLKNISEKSPLSNPNVVDVSKEYVDRNIGNLTLELNQRESKEIYLFAFGQSKEFICLQKGQIKESKVIFKNVSYCESILFVGYYDGLDVIPIENPFMMHNWTKNITFLIPTKNTTRSIRLYRKYPMNNFVEDVFYNELIGAKIQGSNFKDFRSKQDVFIFKAYPVNTDKVEFKNKFNFQYYRYLPNTAGQINLAELHFIFSNEQENQKLKNYYQFDSQFKNIKYLYDNSIETYYTSSSKTNWIGIDKSKSKLKNLKAVKVIPRNTYNLIQKGNTYELFYFDFGWKSLGSKMAKDSFIDFENVPNNCLFLLKNVSQGSQERIFIYEKENETYSKQVFW